MSQYRVVRAEEDSDLRHKTPLRRQGGLMSIMILTTTNSPCGQTIPDVEGIRNDIDTLIEWDDRLYTDARDLQRPRASRVYVLVCAI